MRDAHDEPPPIAGGACVLGLDIGGSKTHAMLVEDTGAVREAFGPSANPASVGVTEAVARLGAVLTDLGTDGVSAVYLGSAGVDSPQTVGALTTALRALVPPQALIAVGHDARLGLAAAGLDTGVVLISGTGSVAWGRGGPATSDPREVRVGGWGYLLGDEGSGYRVGIDAARHALRRADAGEPPDALSAALLADCGLQVPDQLIDLVHGGSDRRFWARRAGVVATLAEASDPVALALLDDAATALAALAALATARLGPATAVPVVLAGGFLQHTPLLRAGVAARLPGVDLRLLDTAPVVGAVRLARGLAATGLPTPSRSDALSPPVPSPDVSGALSPDGGPRDVPSVPTPQES